MDLSEVFEVVLLSIWMVIHSKIEIIQHFIFISKFVVSNLSKSEISSLQKIHNKELLETWVILLKEFEHSGDLL